MLNICAVNEQKEILLKLCRLTYTNIEIRDDSVVFLLDKDGFLSEGLPESAYLEYKLYESQVNYLFQRDSQSRKMIFSELSKIITVYRNYFLIVYLSFMSNVKNIFIIGLLLVFFSQFLFSQSKEHINGGQFVKRIEYNLKSQFDSTINLESKGIIGKLFFGDFNAPVEFYYLPSSTSAMYKEIISAFRIVRNSSNTLEVRYISNYKEAGEEAQKKYPVIGRNLTTEHNKDALAKQHEEMSRLYKIETVSFHISELFAENLYKKIVLLIENFKAKGAPPLMTGGYGVEFRTVVDDELWSLNIWYPRGDALKMADLCRQIITDAIHNQLDEQSYIYVLDTF